MWIDRERFLKMPPVIIIFSCYIFLYFFLTKIPMDFFMSSPFGTFLRCNDLSRTSFFLRTHVDSFGYRRTIFIPFLLHVSWASCRTPWQPLLQPSASSTMSLPSSAVRSFPAVFEETLIIAQLIFRYYFPEQRSRDATASFLSTSGKKDDSNPASFSLPQK